MIPSVDIIKLVILIALSALFSGAETALISISRFKVDFFVKKKKRGSIALSKLKENPHKMLITLLICNNVVNISASVIATNLSLTVFQNNPLAITTGVMTFIILVFGEIVPKNQATTHAGKLSLMLAPIIYWLSLILFPVIAFFDFITTKIFRVKQLHTKITEEEVRNIVDIAKEEGGIEQQEKEMIHKIFKFDDIDVDEIKVPRIDIIGIEHKSKLKDALALIKKQKFSRLPVYDKTMDKIIGIFYFKDALDEIKLKRFDTPLEKLMRTALYIPETKKIDETLKLLQKKKQQMAIIVDEHGGVSGLITMEDILEEIVGEIQDETEKVEPVIKKIDKRTFKVLGKTDIEEINKKCKIKLQVTDDYDTISGFILHHLGRIPKMNEEIEINSAKLTVKKIEDNRILEVTIRTK